jgi:hypothetical protein
MHFEITFLILALSLLRRKLVYKINYDDKSLILEIVGHTFAGFFKEMRQVESGF